jgi:hypothetical protein
MSAECTPKFVSLLPTTLYNAFISLVLLALVSLLVDCLTGLIQRLRGRVQASYLFNPRTQTKRDNKPGLQIRCARASASVALFLALQAIMIYTTAYLSHILISSLAARQMRWQCRAWAGLLGGGTDPNGFTSCLDHYTFAS